MFCHVTLNSVDPRAPGEVPGHVSDVERGTGGDHCSQRDLTSRVRHVYIRSHNCPLHMVVKVCFAVKTNSQVQVGRSCLRCQPALFSTNFTVLVSG